MNFLVFTNTKEEKVVLNLANVTAFSIIRHNNELMTVIDTTTMGIRYYAKGDITKDLAGVTRQGGGTFTILR